MNSDGPAKSPATNLCLEHDFDGDARDLIERLCRELFDDAGIGIPVDVDVLASWRNIIRVETTALDHDANIAWDGSHFVVQVNAEHPTGRRRFSVCHEIVHTFFPAAETSRGTPDLGIGRYTSRDEEEYLCDVGAAELLLPAAAMSPRLSSVPDMNAVVSLAAEFEASIEATARRVLRLTGLPGAVVVLEEKLKPTEERALRRAHQAPSLPGLEQLPPRPKLRVRYADCTTGDFIPANKSVDPDCALADAVERGEAHFVGETGLVPGRFRVSARHLPYSRGGRDIARVVALLLAVDDN